jgi:hypothetical protein
VLDIGAGGLGDPQPVQREQRDQRVPGRRPEPGRRQKRAELVAVQGDGVGLVVDPRPADMGGRGAIEQLFLDRVLAGPGDGAQPPGDGGAGPASGFQVPGEALDVGTADGEQGHRAGPAPADELAQVQGVGLPGQAAVPGQEPSEGESLGIGEGRLDRGERGRWGGSGHRAPPGRAETREAGPAAGPSNKAETHRKLRPPVTPGHSPLEPKSRPVAREMLEIADSARVTFPPSE